MIAARAQSVVKPRALECGDKVAIVSPSWGGPGAWPHRFDRALARIEQLGFGVKVMPNARLDRSWTSGTIEERVDDFHRAFADEEVRAVLCSIGGDHSAQLLSRLDFDLIAAHPKVFCGNSDITVLHHALYAKSRLATFYGPSVQMDFGEWPEAFAYTLECFLRVTGTTEAPGVLVPPEFVVDEFLGWSRDTDRPRRRRPATPWIRIRAGCGEGPLLVACLPSACQLLGTPWQPNYAGHILVLETPPPPYSVADADRDLWHLRNAALLSDLAGLALARPCRFDAEETRELHRIVLEATAPAYPILADLDAGHTEPKLTLPIGVRGRIDELGLTILEPAVV